MFPSTAPDVGTKCFYKKKIRITGLVLGHSLGRSGLRLYGSQALALGSKN